MPAESSPVESVRRLPVVVANIPAPIQAAPHGDIQPSAENFQPDQNQQLPLQLPSPPRISESDRQRAERRADDSWREPETLLKSLNDLPATGPTSRWKAEVVRQIRVLGPAVAGGSDESTAILERLVELNRQAPELAAKISDETLARKLCKTNFALGRRIDVWQAVVRLGVPQLIDSNAAVVDPQKLTMCLAGIDSLTRNSAEGEAWRQYLLVDALRQSAERRQSAQDRTTQQLARQVLERLTQTPMTSHQQKFVASRPVAVLRDELRRWAAEPIGATILLRDIETYERTDLPSDARRLALDFQHLTVSPIEGRRRLAECVDLHYRNANLRIAVTEELLNKLIPERDLEYAPVDDTVLGRPVRGERLMTTDVAVRMLPDPHYVRMALEVTGKISAMTTAEAGSTRLHSDSQSYYVARKPLQIDMNGISTWPVEVNVQNETQLTGVDTPLDGVPLIGGVARVVVRSQAAQSTPAATEEVRQKVAAQARERVDAETRQRLTAVVRTMNERVFDPLNSLSLDPQMVAAETDSKRFMMRLRLAGEDQLGSHTPRRQAPENSLASVQIHESVLNNVIQRLQLNGREFTLPELSQHVAKRLNRPAPWEINPEHADVKISFAEKDAVIVRCQGDSQGGKLILTLSIKLLSKGKYKWSNFQIQAYYKPKKDGRSAELGARRDSSSQPRDVAFARCLVRHFLPGVIEEQSRWTGAATDREGKEARLRGDHPVRDRRRLDLHRLGAETPDDPGLCAARVGILVIVRDQKQVRPRSGFRGSRTSASLAGRKSRPARRLSCPPGLGPADW